MGSISEIIFCEDPCHMETIQFIYIGSQLSMKRQYLRVNCLRTDMRYIAEFVCFFVYSCMNEWTKVWDLPCVS